jgi:hypothetical protein
MRRSTTSFLTTLGFAALAAACSDESGPVQPEPVVVASYLESLPTWASFSPPVADEDFVEPGTGHFEQQGNMVCTDREASLTRNPQDLVMFSPDAEVMWLGSLIQGRGHRDGLGSLLELPIRQRAPLTIAIDLLYSANRREVAEPDVSTVAQGIGELIDGAQGAGHKAGSSIFYSEVRSHSFDQSVLGLGLSKTKLGRTVRASLQTERTDSSSTLLASFTQKMFTTSVVLPQSAGELFSPDFTGELLQQQIDRGNIGPDNLPVYVSSITWGRMLLVEMTSNHSVRDMRLALAYVAKGDSASRGDSVSVNRRRVLDDSEIKVVAIGGHAEAALDLIRTGQLGKYFEKDAPLTSARPLSYVLRNLGDNTIARVSETTAYTIRECEPNAVRSFNSLADWALELRVLDEDTLTWQTTAANLAKSVEYPFPPASNVGMAPRLTFLADSTDFPFDFYLENRSAAQIPEDEFRREGLVFQDTEFSVAGGWISIGDADGAAGHYVQELENDDFDLVIERAESPVYAIGIDVYDNVTTGGESITIKGRQADGTEFLFTFREGIPTTGFVGFIAPFPIWGLFFDEDAGGDDIAVRDFRFGVK